MPFYWIVHDSHGEILRSTERFGSRDEAEAWMGANWSSLLDEGGEEVSLMSDDERVYRMGLRAE